MKTEIIERETELISQMVSDAKIKLSALKAKKERLDFSSPFTDSLGKHFYGGKVGFMSKKDNARKDRELNKYVDTCNTSREIDDAILKTEKQIEKLNSGNYLIRKNGLIVESYRFLTDKLDCIDDMIERKKIKGMDISKAQMNTLKDIRKETIAKIRQRENK